MAITTNRLVELATTTSPTSALGGTTWSFAAGDLVTEVNAVFNAEVTGTLGVMQPCDTVDLDGNGSYEGTYQGRFNYLDSTFNLGGGAAPVSGTINIIEITVGGTPKYFVIIGDALAAGLDGNGLNSIEFGPTMASSPNTAGLNFDDATTYELVCFAKGTEILTNDGNCPVEHLKIGDLVLTKDNGYQKIRWIGSRKVSAKGSFAPVVFLPGSIGNNKTLQLSQQHRVHIAEPMVELYFGDASILAAAKSLINGKTIFTKEGGEIEYFHVLFDQHELVFTNGTWTESFFPTARTLTQQDAKTQSEVLALFPQLAKNPASYGKSVRPCLRHAEAKLLAKMLPTVSSVSKTNATKSFTIGHTTRRAPTYFAAA
ncbi:MAG: Hint domain-containing protein [Sulfitobacter sp.]|nr:Hint domain-containing protein [Sulfitobacter sp.]